MPDTGLRGNGELARVMRELMIDLPVPEPPAGLIALSRVALDALDALADAPEDNADALHWIGRELARRHLAQLVVSTARVTLTEPRGRTPRSTKEADRVRDAGEPESSA